MCSIEQAPYGLRLEYLQSTLDAGDKSEKLSNPKYGLGPNSVVCVLPI